jgi:hypothetical protein
MRRRRNRRQHPALQHSPGDRKDRLARQRAPRTDQSAEWRLRGAGRGSVRRQPAARRRIQRSDCRRAAGSGDPPKGSMPHPVRTHRHVPGAGSGEIHLLDSATNPSAEPAERRPLWQAATGPSASSWFLGIPTTTEVAMWSARRALPEREGVFAGAGRDAAFRRTGIRRARPPTPG